MRPRFFLIILLFSTQICVGQGKNDYLQKGEELNILGKYEEAIRYFRAGTKVYLQQKDTLNAILCYANLANNYPILGKTAEILTHEKEIFPLLKFKSSTSGFLVLNFVNLYRAKGNLEKQKFYLKYAEEIVNKLAQKDYRLIANFYSIKGTIASDLADYELAIKSLEYAQSVAVKIPKNDFVADELATTQLRLGIAYFRKNNPIKSAEYSKKALNYAQLPNIRSNIYSQLIDSYLSLNPDSAYQYINQAFALQKENKLTSKLLITNRQLGEYYYHKKDKRGIKFINEAIALSDSLKDFPNKARCLELLGKFAIKDRNLKVALSYFQEALVAVSNQFSSSDISKNPSLNQIIFKNLSLSILYKKLLIYKELYKQNHDDLNLISVINCAKIIDEVIDYQRISFRLEESSLFLNETANKVFSEAIDACYILQTKDKKYIDLAFHFIEKSKSMVLNQGLKMNQKIYFGSVPKELIDKEYDLNKAIGYYENLLNTSKKSDTDIKRKLLETIDELNALKVNIKQNYTSYFQIKYGVESIRIDEIQRNIDSETAIISYFFKENQLFIISINKLKVKFSLGIISNGFFESLSKLNATLTQKPALGEYKGSILAQNLYNQLLKSEIDIISNKKRLIIMRDAELNFLPFEILEKSPNHYLIHDFAISYTYSATIWHHSLQIKDKKNSLLAFAPYTSSSTLPSNFRDATLKPLPASENEVTQIGGTIYKANSATKNKFLEDYRKHGIIHFATHAQVDDVNPDKSFIAFYPENTDYKLFTNDLYLLNLQNTRLVVLSACEAGRGKLQKGEGLMSLARGFAYSGCPSVVTTLWNAHDESMAFLSEHLHKYLQDDLPIDIALQKAKLDYFQSAIGKELDHPYYWANFILIGNFEPVFEENYTHWWIWTGIGVLFLGIVYWFWKRK